MFNADETLLRKEGILAKHKVGIVGASYFQDLALERELLSSFGAQVEAIESVNEEGAHEILEDADGIILYDLYPGMVSRGLIEHMRRCKVIGICAIGTDSVDLSAATDHNIVVTHVPSYCENEVAEHTLALLLACRSNLWLVAKAVKEGRWEWKDAKVVYSLRNQVLGLVGFGKIARLVAEKACAFGMEIVFFDPYVTEGALAGVNARAVTLEDLLATADFVSIHAPLTSTTRHLLGEKEFAAMKQSAYLINTARGGIVDERVLLQAITNGDLAGAALDVLEKEPPDPKSPLLNLDSVIITPHVAWYSEKSERTSRLIVTKNVIRVLTGQEPDVCVNPELRSKLNFARKERHC